MSKRLLPFLSLLIAFSMFFSCISGAEEAKEPMKKVSKLPFGKWYKPVDYKVSPKVKGYSLPLSQTRLTQFQDALAEFGISPNDTRLTENGFTLSNKYTDDDIAGFYSVVRDKKLPIYITTDSVLHLYHILFDKILAEAEEKNFTVYLANLFKHTIAQLDQQLATAPTEEAKAAIILAKNYTLVASALLSGSNGNVKEVNDELALISAHTGYAPSPLFVYKEDYSQYVPRGHYTHSEALKNYFRAMMWLGRITFLAKGKEKPEDNALVDIKVAKKQTLAASLLADILRKYPKKAEYEVIYDFTSFFVGYSDDVTPNEYNNALSEVIGTNGNIFSITQDDVFKKLQLNILKFAPPAIYSGLGDIEINDLEALLGQGKPEELQKALASTMGMRLMGQRFVIDSYFTGKMVFPTIGNFQGRGTPFTGAPRRTMPTALDVMMILGSESAQNLLTRYQMTRYENYFKTVKGLKEELATLSDADWNKNLYMGWLHSLRALFAKSPAGYQPFQRTNTWENRQLISALGSWTALRHDTILYVKQSSTLKAGCAYQPPAKCNAYVEGEPEFWARLLALHQTMQRGIKAYNLNFSYEINNKLGRFDFLLNNLLQASIAQLEEKPISKQGMDYLENIADYIKGIQGKEYKEFTTRIVADVHTDGNTNKVLEEGTGSMQALIVAYSNPDGSISIAVGPVYSYYEFKHPMSDRLTDEKWRAMLNRKTPKQPSWIEEMISKPVGVPKAKDRF